MSKGGALYRTRRRFLLITSAILGAFSRVQGQSAGTRKRYPTPPGPENEKSIQPREGFVPNEQTAIRIAEAVLIPIYGEEDIRSQRPFRAALARGVWTVTGTLPPRFLGGTAIVRLAKSDGRILFVIHEA
jgi:hypothetical protein